MSAHKYSKNVVSPVWTDSLYIKFYYVHGRQWYMWTPIKSLSVIWKRFLKPCDTYWWCVVFAPYEVFWPFKLGMHYCGMIFIWIFSGRVKSCREKYVLSSYAYINIILTWLIEYIYMECIYDVLCKSCLSRYHITFGEHCTKVTRRLVATPRFVCILTIDGIRSAVFWKPCLTFLNAM